jgi:hypothetical protein
MGWLRKRQELLADVDGAPEAPKPQIARADVPPEIASKVGKLIAQVEAETTGGELELDDRRKEFVDGSELEALASEKEHWQGEAQR